MRYLIYDDKIYKIIFYYLFVKFDGVVLKLK